MSRLDPIVPLAVSIADGPGTIALFLGSGVSKEAGILTGEEILEDTQKRIYKVANKKDATTVEELQQWLKSKSLHKLGYGKLLEEIAPSTEERRKFLEKYFEGREPTEAHKTIAELVKDGQVKVILTTNFDRLMETALEELEINFDLISSKEEINQLKPREHSNCRIVKLHGDYKKMNIRNTPSELANLPKEIKNEFIEILNRYGLLVVGYGGNDKGVMNCMKARKNPQYTLYWTIRSEPNHQAKELINLQSGRFIKRKSATTLFKELSTKINSYLEHPLGDSPKFIINETTQLIRKDDDVGIGELQKNLKENIREKWYEIYNEIKDDHKRATEGYECLSTEADKIIAHGLKLIDLEKYEHFNKILNFLETTAKLSNYRGDSNRWINNITSIPMIFCHDMLHIWGAYLVKKREASALKEILRYKIMFIEHRKYEEEYMPIVNVNELFFQDYFKRDMDAFNNLMNIFEEKEYLKDIFVEKEDFVNLLYQFNFLLCLEKSRIKEDSYAPYPYFLVRRALTPISFPNLYRIRPLVSVMKHEKEFTFSLFDASLTGIFREFEAHYGGYIKGEQNQIILEQQLGLTELFNKKVGYVDFSKNQP